MRTLYFHPVVFSFLLSLFILAYSQPSQIGYHTSIHDVALVRIYNAGLKCGARGSLKIQDAKIAKNLPSGNHHTTFSGYIFTSKVCIDNRKKPVKQQYLLHMFSQYGVRRPTTGWHRFRNFGHPSKFQRVSRVGFVTTPTSLNGRQPNFARCLAVSWAGTIYTLCLKNVPPLACYNFDAHEWILIFFGRNVTDKVGN